MDIRSVDLFFYLIFISFVGIISTNNTTLNCGGHEAYFLDHGCTCGYFGAVCSWPNLNLKGQGLPFLNFLVGNFSLIESIDFSDNENRFTIPNNLFTPFINLRNLRIHNCNVVDIETGAFRSLRSLETLEISWNSFLTFDSITNGLRHLDSPKLEVLNISGNHNAEQLLGAFIRPLLFEFLSNSSLKVLDVSWTRLTTLLAPFTLLPHLQKLDISGTLLLGTTGCISTLQSLRNLSHLVIDHWPFFPRGNDNVRYLEEPRGLFKRDTRDDCIPVRFRSDRGCIIPAPHIRTLQARNIDMDSFFLNFSRDMCFEENNFLNIIISHSKVSKQMGLLFGCEKLKLFDMSYPDISFGDPLIKPHVFYAMPSLKTLRLNGCYLNRMGNEHLEKLFNRNHNLTELDISHNKLLYIPKDMFLKNIYLEYLNVSWNKLTVFEADLSGCIHLISLDLGHNSLKHLDIGLFQHINSLGRDIYVNLVENEFECDCRLLNFIQNMNVTTAPFMCDNDGESTLITQHMSQTNIEKICDNSHENTAPVAVLVSTIFGALVIVVVFIVVVVIIYRRRKPPADGRIDQPNLPVVTYNLNEHGKESRTRSPRFIVFLAYCSKDYQFVMRKIYHKLNTKLLQFLPHIDQNQLIILYDKNFLAGIDIDEICRVAIIESHVTVAVVTENFLESPWCNLEVKMAISSKVPLLPLFITKCEVKKLTGFLRVVYEEKVRLLWPETSALDETLAEVEENKLLDTLCTHIMTYVKLHQENEESL